MTLTPEQIAKGWKLHDGSDVCPIKDERTVFSVILHDRTTHTIRMAKTWEWKAIAAYRIIEAHGADAEPARPTPFPRDYSDLVFDAAGWSQTIIVDGKRPEWLRDDDIVSDSIGEGSLTFRVNQIHWRMEQSIRVRRREPKRETVLCFVVGHAETVFPPVDATIDLIDGKPDLSTLKIAEDAL